MHVGVSTMSVFKVQGTGTNNRTTSFGQRPEFDIGEGSMSATGTIPFVSHVWAAGPELGPRWRRLLVKGEYYHVGIERQATLPTLNFQGWYAGGCLHHLRHAADV
jgi:phosphate-selective porin OprO/OprP